MLYNIPNIPSNNTDVKGYVLQSLSKEGIMLPNSDVIKKFYTMMKQNENNSATPNLVKFTNPEKNFFLKSVRSAAKKGTK